MRRILVVGGGGREHALVWTLTKSRHHPEVFVAPGNAGTAEIATNVAIDASDIDALLDFADRKSIDITVVGPEQPLVAGIVDRFVAAGHKIVGPTAAASQLEGSKEFAKAFMERHGVPSARYRAFGKEQLDEALDYLEAGPVPIVVKADGLAAGKGVIVCTTRDQAKSAVRDMLAGGVFGDAGSRVVIEGFLEGEEASVFVLADGLDYRILAPAQDHKRAFDNDLGPNTGGMGAYSPAPIVDQTVMDLVRKEVIEPVLKGMEQDGMTYAGFLYCGLMIGDRGPQVVEFNCRMGDPEAQVVLPVLGTDLVDLLIAFSKHELGLGEEAIPTRSAACVVLASGGYPGGYKKGKKILGLDIVDQMDNVVVFHAGTQRREDEVYTSGGRVLAVTATGASLPDAIERAYEGVGHIEFEDMQFRTDIGRRGLLRIEAAKNE